MHIDKKSHVLIVGYGDLGAALAAQLLAAGHQVTGVCRSLRESTLDIKMLQADVMRPETLQNLAALKADFMVYCASAGGQTDEQYREIYVDGLHNTLQALKDSKHLQHVFFVSSTRVYGQEGDALLDEESSTDNTDFGGERLLQGEALLKDLKSKATALRFSGIYGANRTRMLRLAAAPATWPAKNSWSNRIHRDDGAAFIVYLIEQILQNRAEAHHKIENLYLVTDSKPTSQYEVLGWLANAMQIDASQIVIPYIEGGKRLSNARMLNTGFKLQYPDFQAGYREMLKALVN